MSTPAAAGPHKHTNRLAQSTSPYLLQHAHNPVDWYPWGPEAFAAARAQDKPIFLSVGYSTCYWCHVMERQSFESEEIAARMNELFVNVKVDREERPDVDQLYMTAVQIIARQGGWPMSVFLTPDLRPFFAGTYFPPADNYGRPGFPRVLQSIAGTYRTKLDQVDRSANEIVRLLKHHAEPRQPAEPLRVDLNWVELLIERSTADYEQCYGGYGGAPKFPRQTLLELVIAYLESPDATEDAEQMLSQIVYTLDFMADGGIRDQLGGGFHRYSTDEKWLVPHFEIMLYDQAMLAVVYTKAWQVTEEPRYAKVARGILDFVLREMMGPSGEFYTAFDAEVDAQEGLSYLWTPDEVRDVLASFPVADLDLFLNVYGLSAGPNFADPHHGSGQPDKNILHLPTPLADVAKSVNVTEDQLDARLEPMRQALYAARAKRKQPQLDTKVLTSWNGLMIRAFALAGKALGEPRYVEAARAACGFVLGQHLKDGTLLRTSRPDARPAGCEAPPPLIPGFLDDYAFMVQALLATAEASGDSSLRAEARRLAGTMKERFLDPELGAFYFTAADATDLIVRQKTAADSPLPSGNAVAAACLLELGDAEAARQTIAVFAQQLEDHAEGMSSLVQATLAYLGRHEPFTVSAAGEQEDERVTSPDQLAKAAVELSGEWASPTELLVTAKVLDTFHLNANRAAQGMIPTTLTLALPRGVDGSATVDYPPGEERRFAFVSEAIRVYEGEVIFVARLAQPLPAGTPVRAVLTYQPCTEDACLAATSKAIELMAP
jgi:hypothetical protein